MDDNYSLWKRRNKEEERWLAKRPVCCICDNHIQEERLWVINDEPYHEECAESEFKKWTEDYIL